MGQEIGINELIKAGEAVARVGQQIAPQDPVLSVVQEIRGMIGDFKSAALAFMEAVNAKKSLSQTQQNQKAEVIEVQAPRIEPPKIPVLRVDELIKKLKEVFDKVKDKESNGKKFSEFTFAEVRQKLEENPAISALVVQKFYEDNYNELFLFQ